MRKIRDLDCGLGVGFSWVWKFGRDPSDFDSVGTIWLGPFRFWVFW